MMLFCVYLIGFFTTFSVMYLIMKYLAYSEDLIVIGSFILALLWPAGIPSVILGYILYKWMGVLNKMHKRISGGEE